MRVAFPHIDRRIWQGGYNYLLNLFSALDEFSGSEVRPVLFAGDDIPGDDTQPFRALKNATVVAASHFNASNMTRRQIRALFTGMDSTAQAHYNRHGIDLIFENAFYHGRRMTVPVLVWIPDFQHRCLSNLFSRKQYWKREMGFRFQLSSRRHVLVSSVDASKNLHRFYPTYGGSAHVLPFSVSIPSDGLAGDPDRIRTRYQLPKRFFYLPNQFYQHKNHLLVLDALKLLGDKGLRPVVAASGNPYDHLASDVMRRIKDRIADYRLENQFILLGAIPYGHVIGLMRCADALINPSLSEGWSTTVEEAKALGKELILSDLDVHKEQAGRSAVYFGRHNPQDLAVSLERFLRSSCFNTPMNPDLVLAGCREKRRVFADGFCHIARHCLGSAL